MELLVTVGIVLAFTIPVLFLLLSVTSVGQENTAKAQAEATARSLADTMNLVYAQGSGAKKVILINVPSSTESISAANGEVVIRIKTAGGIYEAAYPTFAKISSKVQNQIKQRTGLFEIVVENENNEVKLVDRNPPAQ